MSANSNIGWTDHTFNPWWGCTKISPGCTNCYAATFSSRTGLEWGPTAARRFFGDKHWNEPVKWNKKARVDGKQAKVFCASMADVFEGRPELDDPRARLWTLMEKTPFLNWLLLTKRPENINPMSLHPGLPVNAWIGTSVENQEMADKRIPELVKVPATVRFLSCEPLLGPVKLQLDGIHWVIVGGESGPNCRPMNPDWARSIRDQCAKAGVAFFFKQWGEYCAPNQVPEDTYAGWDSNSAGEDPNDWQRWRFGKKNTGNFLDQEKHEEFPA